MIQIIGHEIWLQSFTAALDPFQHPLHSNPGYVTITALLVNDGEFKNTQKQKGHYSSVHKPVQNSYEQSFLTSLTHLCTAFTHSYYMSGPQQAVPSWSGPEVGVAIVNYIHVWKWVCHLLTIIIVIVILKDISILTNM